MEASQDIKPSNVGRVDGWMSEGMRRRRRRQRPPRVTPQSNAALNHRIPLSEGGHRKLFPRREAEGGREGRTSCFANEPNSDGEKRNHFQQRCTHKSRAVDRRHRSIRYRNVCHSYRTSQFNHQRITKPNIICKTSTASTLLTKSQRTAAEQVVLG